MKSFKLIPDPHRASSTVFKFDDDEFSEFDIHTEFLHEDDDYTFLLMFHKESRHCGCDFEKLVNLNKKFTQLNFNFSDLFCDTPDRLKGRLMKDIAAGEMLCDNGCQNSNDCQCFTREIDQSVMLNCTKFDFNNFTLLGNSSQPLDSKYEHLKLVFHKKSELPVIPENFKLKITEIVAPGNKIRNVSIENLASDHLKILDLRDNRIFTLNAEDKEKLKGMKKVSLGGNPWICDCTIFNLFNELYTKSQMTDHDDIYCTNLEKYLVEVEVNDVCFHWTFLIAILGTLCGFLAALIALFYKFNKDIKNFLYHHNLCLW